MRTLDSVTIKSHERVILRAGFDLPLGSDGEFEVGGDARLKEGLKTLEFLAAKGARIAILNHFGRPLAREGKFSNRRIVEKLKFYYRGVVEFIPEVVGPKVLKAQAKLAPGEAIFCENTRFDPRELTNDAAFGRELAQLGELYVNDAFNAAYDNHTSLVAIADNIIAVAGFQLEKEVGMMERLAKNPDRPLVVVLGGAKVNTKISLIEKFLKHADQVILGGALANTILHLQGVGVGRSLVDLDALAAVSELDLTNTKLHMPVDAIVSVDAGGNAPQRVAPIGKLAPDEMILDVGPDSRALFDRIVGQAKMVLWNGPLGKVETSSFRKGTLALVDSIERSGAFAVTGGGDSMTFLSQEDKLGAFDYVSTGGGSMLEYLSGRKLPALEKLQ